MSHRTSPASSCGTRASVAMVDPTRGCMTRGRYSGKINPQGLCAAPAPNDQPMPLSRSVEQPPERAEPDAWVLRGGTFDPDSVWTNHGRVLDAYGLHGLCVTTWHGRVVDDGAQHLRVRSARFCHALVSELRDAGCDVVREPGKDWPRSLLIVPGRPMISEIEALQRVFFRREMRDNPNAAPRKGGT
jgi:hypothetical protein